MNSVSRPPGWREGREPDPDRRIEAQAEIYRIALRAIEIMSVGRNDPQAAATHRIASDALLAAQALEEKI